VTQVPWGIELWGAVRHPTQIYAILAAISIALIVWPRKSKGDHKGLRQPGVLFLTFLALTATARIFIETFHGDSVLLPGSVRALQVFAWFVLAVSLWLLGKRLSAPNTAKTLYTE
jgi:phosphatidylglycerol---prolipoprotein diacylglyceryl transferase